MSRDAWGAWGAWGAVLIMVYTKVLKYTALYIGSYRNTISRLPISINFNL